MHYVAQLNISKHAYRKETVHASCIGNIGFILLVTSYCSRVDKKSNHQPLPGKDHHHQNSAVTQTGEGCIPPS